MWNSGLFVQAGGILKMNLICLPTIISMWVGSSVTYMLLLEGFSLISTAKLVSYKQQKHSFHYT